MEVRGQHARRSPGGPHADQHRVRRALELQEVQVVGQRARHDGNLDDLGARPRASTRTRSIRSAGTPSKSCVDRTMRLPPVEAISSRRERRLELDIDVLGALLKRAVENLPALDFRVLEGAAFPLRAGTSR